MIHEDRLAELLRAATDDIDINVEAVPARELADAGGRRRRQHRVLAVAATATAVAVVGIGVPVALNAYSSDDGAATSQPIATPSRGGCEESVPSGLLPTWARGGFSEPKPHIPYVMGANGDIVAILFAQPLTAPPSADHNNKVLWVSRVGSGTLHIDATLADGSAVVQREVSGGPGPSIIDLPQSGCWHLDLRWGGTTDSLDLLYAAP